MPPFDTANNITSKIHTVKLFTMQFFTLILYLTFLRSKLSHQNTPATPETLQLVYLLLNVMPCFSPRVGHVGFVVDKVALGQVFLQALWFSLPVIIPPVLHSHPSSVAGREGSFESHNIYVNYSQNTSCLMFLFLIRSYTASLSNMFRPLHVSSSG